MRATVLLSSLFALAATVTAAPALNNGSPVPAELMERSSCPQGYYPCVTGQNQVCVLACMSVRDPIPKMSCLQSCTNRSHANCRSWCG